MSGSMVPLGDVADFVNGFAFKPEDWENVGLPIIRIQNLTGNGNGMNRTTRVVPDKYRVRSGDLLVSWSASLGVFQWNGPEALVNQHIFKVEPRFDRVCVDYLRHAIDASIHQMERFTHGSTMKHINRREFLDHRIPLPPLAEQRRIAAILDKADALRRWRQGALDLLDKMIESIFTDMFGDIDTLSDRQNVLAFGALVADQRIGLVRSAQQLSNSGSGTPYIRMDAIGVDGHLSLDNVLRTTATTLEIRDYQLQSGDFLFNTRNSRELVGKTAIFYGPEGCIYNNNILRVRFTRAVTPEYMLSYFRTKLARKELENRKSGTTSVFAIYQRSLDTLPVVVPPIAQQEDFTRRMLRARQLRAGFVKNLERQESLFSSLQHRAFSGQL